MKPIPEALRAYFPNVINADRPWWNREDVPMGFFVGSRWSRPDGYETDALSDREEIDRAHPMQPPPILVGQVWALPLVDGGFRVSAVLAVEHRHDGHVYVNWSHSWSHELTNHKNGILLTCPFGHAPWSGPEAP